MTSESPPASNRLREQHPGPIFERRIAGGSRNQVGELLDHRELLVTIERHSVRKDLDPDVVAVSVDVRERTAGKIVDESRGVLTEHWNVRNLLNLHQRGGELARERLRIFERSLGGVDVDHWHGS